MHGAPGMFQKQDTGRSMYICCMSLVQHNVSHEYIQYIYNWGDPWILNTGTLDSSSNWRSTYTPQPIGGMHVYYQVHISQYSSVHRIAW